MLRGCGPVSVDKIWGLPTHVRLRKVQICVQANLDITGDCLDLMWSGNWPRAVKGGDGNDSGLCRLGIKKAQPLLAKFIYMILDSTRLKTCRMNGENIKLIGLLVAEISRRITNTF